MRTGLVVLGVLLLIAPSSSRPASPVAPTPPGPALDAPLPKTPLAKPLVFNGGFGDYRIGHFHAGFDLGTGHHVGQPVHAPADGWVERVRASGVGYGRSVYLRTHDGRTLQLGHLDAFAGALAAYVRHVQDSTGQYEQDLWPARGAFPVRAGEVVAWSGESGAGGPHLHFEIRRADMAYHPERAGLVVVDSIPPRITGLTLEPLDDSSVVEGSSAPFAVNLASVDTVRAIGRLRAVVRAADRLPGGTEDRTPWSVGIEWAGRRTECRFDSVSWATDMPEADYVYDAGRITGSKGLVIWAPAGFRPRVLRSDVTVGEEAGTITVRPGDPPRALEVFARDLGGGSATKSIVLRPGIVPPSFGPGWWSGTEPWTGATPVSFASLPGGFLRLTVPGASAKKSPDLQAGSVARPATRSPAGWSALFAVPESAAVRTVRLGVAVRAASPSGAGGFIWARRDRARGRFELGDEAGRLRADFPPGALFEDATVLAYARPASAATGLASVGGSWQVEPARQPLHAPVRIRLVAPARASLDRVGLYRLDKGGWSWLGAERDSIARAVTAESWHLGRFALFRDTVPPRAALVRPPAPPAHAGPYSRWAVEARVTERGSGLDARSSWFEIDGHRVPTEWDPEAGRLRWRPERPPKRGTHKIVIVATDRSRNESRNRASFRVSR